jgi:hypothetical protein
MVSDIPEGRNPRWQRRSKSAIRYPVRPRRARTLGYSYYSGESQVERLRSCGRELAHEPLPEPCPLISSDGAVIMSKSQRPVKKLPDGLLDLRLEEYKSLRAEVLERIREANTLIITTAGGIGGAYAVLVSTFAREPALSISHAGELVISCFLLIVWTPVAFAALAAIKSRDIWQIVLEISDHVSEIEYSMAIPLR